MLRGRPQHALTLTPAEEEEEEEVGTGALGLRRLEWQEVALCMEEEVSSLDDEDHHMISAQAVHMHLKQRAYDYILILHLLYYIRYYSQCCGPRVARTLHPHDSQRVQRRRRRRMSRRKSLLFSYWKLSTTKKIPFLIQSTWKEKL